MIDTSQQQDYSSYYKDTLSSLTDMINSQKEVYSNYSKNMSTTQDKLNKLMERIGNDNLGTGNPFIDMLDGYIRMKKKSNPNYEWEGLLPKAIGLFNKDKQQQAPIISQKQSFDDRFNQFNNTPINRQSNVQSAFTPKQTIGYDSERNLYPTWQEQ